MTNIIKVKGRQAAILFKQIRSHISVSHTSALADFKLSIYDG